MKSLWVKLLVLNNLFIRSTKTELAETNYLKQVGERLKYYRKKAGYSNYEYFAYENNISRPQYGKYEAGANIQ